MIYRFLSYLKFLFKATNQHGVHSPFVYNFVTKGLYKKEFKNSTSINFSELKKLSKKEQKILKKIISYFNIRELSLNKKTLSVNLNKEYNLLFIKDIYKIKKHNLNNFNSKQILIIHQIHQNKKATKEWQKIIKIKEASVTIDLFYFGLIFFRNKQAKEHFIIRV